MNCYLIYYIQKKLSRLKMVKLPLDTWSQIQVIFFHVPVYNPFERQQIYKNLCRIRDDKPVEAVKKTNKDKFEIIDYYENKLDADIRIREDKQSTFSIYSLYHKTYPEFCLRLSSGINNAQKANKVWNEFKEDCKTYAGNMRELMQLGATLTRIDKEIIIQHPLIREIQLKGTPAELIKKQNKIIQQIKVQKEFSKSSTTSPDLPIGPEKLTLPAEGISSAVIVPNQITQAEVPQVATLPMPTHAVAIDHACHTEPYQGTLITNPPGIKVMLDANILLLCFSRGEDENVNRFGRELFQSLLNNPRVSQIIIPSHIANIEVSGISRTSKADGSDAKISVFREHSKVGQKYYRQELQELLASAVYCYEDYKGHKSYWKDPRREANPKVMIWDNQLGRKLRGKMSENNQDEKVDSKDFGELQLENIASQFPIDNNIVILTTDDTHIAKQASRNVKKPNICRMNLNYYIHNLITKSNDETLHWAQISGFENAAKGDTAMSDLYHYLANHILTKLKQNMPTPSTISPYFICDNIDLGQQLTVSSKVPYPHLNKIKPHFFTTQNSSQQHR